MIPKLAIGFLPTPKIVQNVIQRLKKMVAATTWFADAKVVNINFVGCVLETGVNMAAVCFIFFLNCKMYSKLLY